MILLRKSYDKIAFAMQTLPQAAHNAAQPLITHHAPKAIITSYPHAVFRMKKAPLGALF